MIDPLMGSFFWLLVLQGSGGFGDAISGPYVFPRYFKSEKECEATFDTLHKQLYLRHMCLSPGGEHNQREIPL